MNYSCRATWAECRTTQALSAERPNGPHGRLGSQGNYKSPFHQQIRLWSIRRYATAGILPPGTYQAFSQCSGQHPETLLGPRHGGCGQPPIPSPISTRSSPSFVTLPSTQVFHLYSARLGSTVIDYMTEGFPPFRSVYLVAPIALPTVQYVDECLIWMQ